MNQYPDHRRYSLMMVKVDVKVLMVQDLDRLGEMGADWLWPRIQGELDRAVVNHDSDLRSAMRVQLPLSY